jgi:hypothetical protein
MGLSRLVQGSLYLYLNINNSKVTEVGYIIFSLGYHVLVDRSSTIKQWLHVIQLVALRNVQTEQWSVYSSVCVRKWKTWLTTSVYWKCFILDNAYRSHTLMPHTQFKPNITGFLKHDPYSNKTDNVRTYKINIEACRTSTLWFSCSRRFSSCSTDFSRQTAQVVLLLFLFMFVSFKTVG